MFIVFILFFRGHRFVANLCERTLTTPDGVVVSINQMQSLGDQITMHHTVFDPPRDIGGVSYSPLNSGLVTVDGIRYPLQEFRVKYSSDLCVRHFQNDSFSFQRAILDPIRRVEQAIRLQLDIDLEHLVDPIGGQEYLTNMAAGTEDEVQVVYDSRQAAVSHSNVFHSFFL